MHLPVGGDQHVRPAVVVVVPYGDAHSKIGPGHAGLLGDVGECAIAVVLVEGVAHRLGRLPKIAGTAVHQEDIHPAIVVVVEKGTAGTQRFGQEAAGRHGVFMHPRDAGCRCRHFDKQWPIRSCRSRRGNAKNICGPGKHAQSQKPASGKSHCSYPNLLVLSCSSPGRVRWASRSGCGDR